MEIVFDVYVGTGSGVIANSTTSVCLDILA